MHQANEPLAVTEQPAFNLKLILDLLRQYFLMLVSFVLLASLLATYYAIKARPVYQAGATLMVERPTRMASLEQVMGFMGVSWEFYPNQMALMHSTPVAQRVVTKLKLDKTPEVIVEQGWFAGLFGSEVQPAKKSADQKMHEAVASVQQTVKITQEKGSGVFFIVFDDFDPAMAALKANALAEAYIDEVLEFSIQQKQQLAHKLTSQLPELAKKLQDSEEKLKFFQKQNKILLTDSTENIFADQLNSLEMRLSSLRTEKASLEPSYLRIKSVGLDAAKLEKVALLSSRSEVSSAKRLSNGANAKVNELGLVYGHKHPKMITAVRARELAQTEYNNSLIDASQLVMDEFLALDQQVRNIQQQSGNLRTDIQGGSEIAFELDKLKRDYGYNKQIHDAFLKQSKETDAASSETVQSVNARMLNYAVKPAYPYKPNKRNMVLGSAFVGLLLGLALIFLLENLDNSFKTQKDVENKLGLPVIGLLPDVKNKGDDESKPAMEFSNRSMSAFSEAIRTLRTSVLLASPDMEQKTVLVTSTVPGEGKTTISINLAHALSHLGPTLLIEADLRRPTVSKSTGEVSKRKIGLSEYLSGEELLKDCVQMTEHKDYYQLLSGKIPVNPLEGISSLKFANMLKTLKDKFSFIIIDCAPVMAVSDALVLAQQADEVLYVVRHESTPISVAIDAIKRMRRVNGNIIGVVMNRMKSRSKKYGRYYHYDGSYYANYGYHKD
ncbi:MAG: polysaccharide biosynthesis tyrosine autokinase [Proteobacteria bacterium]|nr:polysaccharide biosynthesis tyrosine autokinase [Pseudomonadota bacterium]